jgi:uncharacterized protein YcbX
VGDVRFDLLKPCSHRVLTSVSTEHGLKHLNGEPLRKLKQLRTADNGNINFVRNMFPCKSSIIRVDDTMEVFSAKRLRAYYGAGNLEASLGCTAG